MAAGPNEFMTEALRLAKENAQAGKGGPFGAVVVYDGKIIARGVNQVTESNDPTAHAEVVAIREACRVLGTFQLTDCELYASCEPCPMCLGAVYWARPERIYYAATRADAAAAGFDDSLIYDEIPQEPGARSLPCVHLDRVDSAEPFTAWGDNEKRTEY